MDELEKKFVKCLWNHFKAVLESTEHFLQHFSIFMGPGRIVNFVSHLRRLINLRRKLQIGKFYEPLSFEKLFYSNHN